MLIAKSKIVTTERIARWTSAWIEKQETNGALASANIMSNFDYLGPVFRATQEHLEICNGCGYEFKRLPCGEVDLKDLYKHKQEDCHPDFKKNTHFADRRKKRGPEVKCAVIGTSK